MTAEAPTDAEARPWAGGARLAIGLGQGLLLFGLHKAFDAKVWPATEPALFWPLCLVIAFAPLIVLGSLTGVRRTTLAAWTATGAAVVAVFAVHAILRQAAGATPLSLTPQVVLASAVFLFIAHHLIVAADAERKLIAPYPAYFDAAWKDGVQLALAALFVGVFWATLELGAALFKLIGLKGFRDVIHKDWFAFPATGLVFAAAVHLTDVRAGLIRGVRTVGLTLLGWLTPLMALIATAFFAALPFTGLKPLWDTRSATAVLLSAAATLIVLINATYQDGDPERRPPAALRHSGRLAALVLVPIVAVAGYGLSLRVGQHGWTPDRIYALACAGVGACYAVGYAVAAMSPGSWLKRLEMTNVATALVVLATLLALFSPLADPARISVTDQIQRLQAGKVSPDAFDFDFLRFRSGRYGVAALDKLKTLASGPNAAAIAGKANEALARREPVFRPAAWTLAKSGADITVYPKGAALPASFLGQDWSQVAGYAGPCVGGPAKCDGYLVDLDGDGVPEVLLGDQTSLWAYESAPDGTWSILGTLAPVDCAARKALREGRFQTVAPTARDIQIEGRRLRLSPNAGAFSPDTSCPGD